MERLKGVRSLAAGGVCVALAVVLPLLFHSMAVSPRIVLPMHYPIFLAGTLLDPVAAAVVGLISPALSMALTGMPTPAQAFRMMGELSITEFVIPMWVIYLAFPLGFAILILYVLELLVKECISIASTAKQASKGREEAR
jgi:hypothetical protein